MEEATDRCHFSVIFLYDTSDGKPFQSNNAYLSEKMIKSALKYPAFPTPDPSKPQGIPRNRLK